MLISYKHKFIFIHNYKVAGISINIALRSYSINNPTKCLFVNKFLEKSGVFGFQLNRIIRKIPVIYSFDEHDSAINIKKKLPQEIWDNYFKFGIVRNPWDWQVSLYHYILERKKHWAHEEVKKCSDFNDYIESGKFKIGHPSQNHFFTNENGDLMVDYIAKFETLEDDFKTICNRIGIINELPHLNKSQRDDYRKYYNAKTKQLVEEYFKKDIELFNYSF